MKKITAGLILAFMSSIAIADSIEVTKNFNLSGELKNCKIFKANTEGFFNLYLFITKCPNSKTTTSTSDKSPTHTSYSEDSEGNNSETIILNGEEYKLNKSQLDMTDSVNFNGETYFKVK
jgi:hypothetical protein